MKCEYCDKEYKNNRLLIKHVIHCVLNPYYIKYKCKYCDYEDENKNRIGPHVLNCKFNPNYENIKELQRKSGFYGSYGRKPSEETKNKISKSRIKYLLENPDKVPYLLNHSSKESYPEKYFSELFYKENIIVEKSFRIGIYELDFCILDKKIDIEIDGSQHYYDSKIIKSDIKRTKFLEDNGWDVIRINWTEYQKMNFYEKSEYIKNLKRYLEELENGKPNIKYRRIKSGLNLCECGETKYKTSSLCLKCRRIKDRKVDRPPINQLIEEVKEFGYRGTGYKYGVSDNTIRKWIK